MQQKSKSTENELRGRKTRVTLGWAAGNKRIQKGNNTKLDTKGKILRQYVCLDWKEYFAKFKEINTASMIYDHKEKAEKCSEIL